MTSSPAGARSGGHVSLLNIISELKKACNHPFLFESAEDEYRGSEEDKSAADRLILTSGKMVLLDKLLTRLRQTGHRVLVFSQVRHPAAHVQRPGQARLGGWAQLAGGSRSGL
jgi:SNF2 family DNA or RNA helicase